MESNTKTTFAPEIIEGLAKAQFGTATEIAEIVPLTAGWFNTAYALHFLNLKPDVVLRIAPDPRQRVLTYEKALMRREVKIIQTASEIPGVPIPRLIGYDFSRELIDRDYMFMARLSGKPFNEIVGKLPPEAVQAIEREVGRCVARLGEVKGVHFGYPAGGPGWGSASWREAFTAIVEVLLRDGEEVGAELPIGWGSLRALVGPRRR
ncbi:MAG: phosphotransferase family protein [Anaerolineae bacterium]